MRNILALTILVACQNPTIQKQAPIPESKDTLAPSPEREAEPILTMPNSDPFEYFLADFQPNYSSYYQAINLSNPPSQISSAFFHFIPTDDPFTSTFTFYFDGAYVYGMVRDLPLSTIPLCRHAPYQFPYQCQDFSALYVTNKRWLLTDGTYLPAIDLCSSTTSNCTTILNPINPSNQ
jgi:hypothetical protein